MPAGEADGHGGVASHRSLSGLRGVAGRQAENGARRQGMGAAWQILRPVGKALGRAEIPRDGLAAHTKPRSGQRLRPAGFHAETAAERSGAQMCRPPPVHRRGRGWGRRLPSPRGGAGGGGKLPSSRGGGGGGGTTPASHPALPVAQGQPDRPPSVAWNNGPIRARRSSAGPQKVTRGAAMPASVPPFSSPAGLTRGPAFCCLANGL